MFLLDTNILIFALRGNEKVLARLRKEHSRGLSISAITLAELRHGIEISVSRQKAERALLSLLQGVQTLPFDDLAAYHYGEIRADLQKRSCLIGSMDMLIGAHALAAGKILVTNNVREFKRINTLKIEDWFEVQL